MVAGKKKINADSFSVGPSHAETIGLPGLLALCIFSSPEPKAPRWAISIPVTPASVVRRPSVVRPSVRPSTFSNIFSSETTGPIELKFHMETP